MGAAIFVGLFYLYFQWSYTNVIKDSLFIGLLLGATLLLLQAMRYLYIFVVNNNMSFFSFSMEGEEYEKVVSAANKLCGSIFNTKSMIISGLLYGSAVGSAVFLMDIWTEETSLRILLFLFLFIINFVTGIGFYGLIMFFLQSWKISRIVKVNLWQRQNPSTLFLRKITHTTAIIASIYICMCMASILFSVIPFGSLTIGYSVFAGIIIIACLIVPEIPIRRKIATEKRETIMDINSQLQIEFKKALNEAKNSQKGIDLTKIDSLISLRQKIEKISVWPFGLRTVVTAVSVIVVTSLPGILQFILEKLFS